MTLTPSGSDERSKRRSPYAGPVTPQELLAPGKTSNVVSVPWAVSGSLERTYVSMTGSSVTVSPCCCSSVSPTQSGKALRCVVLANVIRANGGVPSAGARCRLNVCPPLSRVKTMRSPVGDQAGSASKIVASVMFSAPVPFAFMVQTETTSLRSLTKRIFSPLGDQSGSASRLGVSEVRFPSSPPSSEFIVKMSLSPSRSESKASFVPSGLQVGPRSFPSVSVKLIWALPSTFMTQMSKVPSRLL